jgi:hypothetical protein
MLTFLFAHARSRKAIFSSRPKTSLPVDLRKYPIINNLGHLEARGVEPVPACYVQRRPRTVDQSHFRGEHLFVRKCGPMRMLLVLLFAGKRLETSEIAY